MRDRGERERAREGRAFLRVIGSIASDALRLAATWPAGGLYELGRAPRPKGGYRSRSMPNHHWLKKCSITKNSAEPKNPR